MDVLGAHIRVADNRYAAGFTLVTDDRIIDSWTFPAPADADEGVQLAELYQFALDLIARHNPDHVSIKGAEARSARALCVAHHGEGAVLAAAGDATKPARVWTGSGYRAAVGAPNNEAVLRVAKSSLTGSWPSQSEQRQAAAAALAAIRRANA